MVTNYSKSWLQVLTIVSFKDLSISWDQRVTRLCGYLSAFWGVRYDIDPIILVSYFQYCWYFTYIYMICSYNMHDMTISYTINHGRYRYRIWNFKPWSFYFFFFALTSTELPVQNKPKHFSSNSWLTQKLK